MFWKEFAYVLTNLLFNQFSNCFPEPSRPSTPQILSWNLTKFQASSYHSENWTSDSVWIKFTFYNQKWRKLPLRISSESSFFSRQHNISALVDMVLHFPQRHQSRFPFRSFPASFVYIAEELTSLSVFSLSLTVGSKSYGFSLTKFEKLSKNPHLIISWNHSFYVGETY